MKKSIVGTASVIILTSVAIAALTLSGCGKDSGNQTPTASQMAPSPAAPAPVAAVAPEPVSPPQPVSPTPPSHNYAMVDNGTYGYERALSEEDVRTGTATKPLIMMRYVGNNHGTYVVIILGQDVNDSRVINRLTCQLPCEFAKSELVSDDTVVKTEMLRVAPDSIAGEMLSDAASGQLIPYGRTATSQAVLTQPAPVAPAITPVAVTAPNSETSGPLQQASFDCNQAGSIPQYLICHDPDLAASDRSLADLVQKARAAAQDQAAFSDRLRKQWNYREKTCKDKACLTSWYAYESNVMTKIAQTGDANVK